MLPKNTAPPAGQKGGSSSDERRHGQVTSAAACLARVLVHFGRHGDAAELARSLEVSAEGNYVVNLLDVAEDHGLRGCLTVQTPAEWREMVPASILHWGVDGHVVFLSAGKHSISVYDPSRGDRSVDLKELNCQFAGVALVLAPDSNTG